MGAQQPGLPGSQFPSEDALIRRIQDLERGMRELAAANPFAPMGMKPVPGGVEFSGNLAVPNGSITNAALQNPVTIAQASNSEFAFPVSTTDTTRATTTISVPAGFSQAYVFVVCNIGVLSTMTAGDYLYSSAVIQGVASRVVRGGGGTDGGTVAITTAKSSMLTGLSGGTISAGVAIHADTARIASSDNRAYVEVQAIFLR